MICMDFYKKKNKADNCEINLKITNKVILCDKRNKIAKPQLQKNKVTFTRNSCNYEK